MPHSVANFTRINDVPASEVAAQAISFSGASHGAIDQPAVILLGGEANALSVIRSLGRLGVPVFALGAADSVLRRSRYCTWVAVKPEGGVEAAWARWLLGTESDDLKGAIVLSCSDAGIRVIARHRQELLARFRLDDSDPKAQLQMLDKATTYQQALAAEVDTPKFWMIDSQEQVLSLKDQLVFPLIIKPRLSHVFEARFNRKYIFASNFSELLAAIEVTSAAGVDVLLMEWIPGPDSKLCSYFTYLAEDGSPLFHFTKRIIRRYPAGMGAACYHITDWIPELIEPSLKLFRHVGLRGLANIEYKHDERDGRYKIIECNARFVASNALVASSGFDLAALVYNRITGRPQAPLEKFQVGRRMWDPGRDWQAFRDLCARGEITLPQWLASVAHRQTFQWFSWSDPMPAVARAVKPLRRKLVAWAPRRCIF
jgi:predicted ATP-grasp superfamily ATP-dependent carboligase